MTAEIAIFNKTSIALAADSAATITSNGQHRKIYNGSEKLFTLSKHHPVGVMIYGNSDFCGAPWELLIKSFRSKFSDVSHPKIEDWSKAFFEFVSSGDQIIPAQMREQYFFHFLRNEIVKSISDDIDKIAQNRSVDAGDVISYDEFNGIAISYLDELIESLNHCYFFDDYDANDIPTSYAFARDNFNIITHDYFSQYEESFPDDVKEKLLNALSLIIVKQSPFGVTSGIVIAGFGEDEYYPVILSYDVYGSIFGKTRKILNRSKSSLSSDVNIFPYAQEQEINLILNGCYDELIDNINISVLEAVKQSESQIDSILSENLSNEKYQEISSIIKSQEPSPLLSLKSKISAHTNSNYTQKIISMLRFLPKQELAQMAETLVNLTAFKRKVSDEHETVGGPIDVALISKSDGFIWIKRKLYFSPDLNHHFFSNQLIKKE